MLGRSEGRYKYREVYRISNKMATKIKIPSRVVEVLETPVEKTVHPDIILKDAL